MIAPHILVVDDEPEIRLLRRTALEQNDLTVAEAGTGADMMALIGKRAPDLITLDLKLGGEDGFSLARTVRAQANVPIIMISGKGDMVDRVVGLELGGNDYVAKPFHMCEVVGRVRAVLRRYAGGGEADVVNNVKTVRYTFDGWTLDSSRRQLTKPDGGALRADDGRVQPVVHSRAAARSRTLSR
jgi:DNA-binding response OmpR family regulator